MKKIDLCDQRFGKLLVLRQGDVAPGGGIRWVCRCDCGNEKSILSDSLRKKKGTRSCGCLVAEKTKEAFEERRRISGARGSGFRRIFNRYRFSARYKGLPFELSEDDVASITKQSCTYCECEPLQVIEPSGTPWVYNGLDRVDSSRGYVQGNVVACCETCNTMKMELTLDQFKTHIDRVYRYFVQPQSSSTGTR